MCPSQELQGHPDIWGSQCPICKLAVPAAVLMKARQGAPDADRNPRATPEDILALHPPGDRAEAWFLSDLQAMADREDARRTKPK